MIRFLRLIVLFFVIILGFLVALIRCLMFPFHKNNTHIVTHYMLSLLNKIIGLKVHITYPEFLNNVKSAIYAGNHQSNWDIVALAPSVRPYVLAIGKKSLVWAPLFGLIYFLAGNIRLDRENKTKSIETMDKVSKDVHDGKYSIWIFPEGTRSKGKGLGKFKPGAILTASQAGVPIVPIVASSYINDFDLNRWDNGHVFIEYLEPINYRLYDPKNKQDLKEIREKTQELHDIFAEKIKELDQKALEAAQNR